jgi:hypothetical protein
MRILLISLMGVFAAMQVQAQSTPPSQGTTAGSVLGDLADIVFKEAEKRVIEEYYDRVPGAKKTGDEDKDDGGKKAKKKDKGKGASGKGRGNGLPPGLAKRDQLPPGLAKRGNRLPPGLMKGDLPPDLENKLDDLPENVERVIVDADVLLVQKGTDMILDVIEGVIKSQ